MKKQLDFMCGCRNCIETAIRVFSSIEWLQAELSVCSSYINRIRHPIQFTTRSPNANLQWPLMIAVCIPFVSSIVIQTLIRNFSISTVYPRTALYKNSYLFKTFLSHTSGKVPPIRYHWHLCIPEPKPLALIAGSSFAVEEARKLQTRM